MQNIDKSYKNQQKLNQYKANLNNKNINFKGHTIKEKADGNRVHEFFLPPGVKGAELEVLTVSQDGKQTIKKLAPQKNERGLNFWQMPVNEKERVLYKFYIPGEKEKKAYLDNVRSVSIADTRKLNAEIEAKEKDLEVKTKDLEAKTKILEANNTEANKTAKKAAEAAKEAAEKAKNAAIATKETLLKENQYSVAINTAKPVMNVPKAMYHIVPDSVALNDGKKNVRRNHFYNYGGKLSDMSAKIPEMKKLGIKRLLSTPVFGDDVLSNHGYWTTNPYITTSNKGTLKDFKKIQVDLYKHGMGFVADGAFVNEGMEGIHLADVIKHGENSPFFHWFETHNFKDNGGLQMGLLPINKEAYDNYDVHIVNSPYTHKLESGKVIVSKNDNYNPNKPTFAQIYDTKLVKPEDEAVWAKGDPIRGYHGYDPNMKTYMDSVQPVAIEIPAEEVSKKFKQLNGQELGEGIQLKDKLSAWDNFSFVRSDKSGGVTLWDGNKDIAKLMFMRPESKMAELSQKYDAKKLKAATCQVQDYVCGVGQYWAESVDRTLTEYTAKTLGDELKGDKSAAKIISTLNKLAQDKKDPKIPPLVSELIAKGEINTETIANILDKTKKNNPHERYLAKTPETIKDAVMNTHLDGIEFPREIATLVSSPHLKKLANTEDQIGLSRSELLNHPEYKNMSKTYQKMDKVLQDVVTPKVIEIIKSNDDLSKNLLDGNELKEGAKHTFRLISDDIVKSVVMKSVADYKPKFDNEGNMEWTQKDVTEFQDATRKNRLYKGGSSHEDEVNNFINSLKEGMGRITADDKKEIADNMNKRIKNVDPDIVKIAKLILHKTESGLNLRIDAAKDVADIDEIRRVKALADIEAAKKAKGLQALKVNVEAVYKENIDFVTKFWTKFRSSVGESNPNSYGICEFTDLGDMDKNWDHSVMTETKSLDNTGFTTQTNYNYLYSTPQKLVHDPGEINDMERSISPRSFYALKEALGISDPENINASKMLGAMTIDNQAASHVMQGNQDKARILDTLAMDPFIFRKDPGLAKKFAVIDSVKKSLKGTSSVNDVAAPTDYPRFTDVPMVKDFINKLDAGFANVPNEDWGTKTPEAKLEQILNSHQYNDWLTEKPIFSDKFTKNDYFKFKEAMQSGSLEEKYFDNYKNYLEQRIPLSTHEQTIVDRISESYDKVQNNIAKSETNALIKKYKLKEGDIDGLAKNIGMEQIHAEAKAEKLGKVLEQHQVNSFNTLVSKLGAGAANDTVKISEDDIVNFASSKGKKVEELAKEHGNKFIKNIGSEHIGRREFAHVFSEVFDAAKLSEVGLSNEEFEKLKLSNVHEKYIEPALEKYKGMVQMMVALPGNPTIYAGDDLGMTGGETSCKNIYIQNRNLLDWDKLNDPNSQVAKFRTELGKIMEIRNTPEYSPLVNGHSIALSNPLDKANKPINNLFAMYRYNDESDVITVLNNKGFMNTREVSSRTNSCESIPLVSDYAKTGIPGGLEKGTEYLDQHGVKYIVNDEGKALIRADKQAIELKDSALYIRRKESFLESFVGKFNKTHEPHLKALGIEVKDGSITDVKKAANIIREKINIGVDQLPKEQQEHFKNLNIFTNIREEVTKITDDQLNAARFAIYEEGGLGGIVKEAADSAVAGVIKKGKDAAHGKNLIEVISKNKGKIACSVVGAMGLAAAGMHMYNKQKAQKDTQYKA